MPSIRGVTAKCMSLWQVEAGPRRGITASAKCCFQSWNEPFGKC